MFSDEKVTKMKVKPIAKNLVSYFFILIETISSIHCQLSTDDFFEYYVNGTDDSLSHTSEKALKFVSSSSEDLQRLFLKEKELRLPKAQ